MFAAEIEGERSVIGRHPNKQGIYLQEIGAGKLIDAGEMDSSNLRGIFAFGIYNGYTDTIRTLTFNNEYYSTWDRMQRGAPAAFNKAVGSLAVAAGAILIGGAVVEEVAAGVLTAEAVFIGAVALAPKNLLQTAFGYILIQWGLQAWGVSIPGLPPLPL